MWCHVQIVDRPTQGHKFLSRQYLQPQWVFDSANFRVLAQPELYAVGEVPPPHLSPFVQNEEEGYAPDYLQTMLKLQVSVTLSNPKPHSQTLNYAWTTGQHHTLKP